MSKRIYCADIEADGLLDEATKVWCGVFQEVDIYGNKVKRYITRGTEDTAAFFTNPSNTLIMHNGSGYDGPVISKLIGQDVVANIWDTLWLSWYLYPQRMRHGLEQWGEELGVEKPVIDDWEDLTESEYIHRCKEDVKIQTLLWQQMYSHLQLLYKDHGEIMHLVKHLNFKAECLAAQEKSKWRLDVKGAEDLLNELTVKSTEATEALDKVLPDVPVYAKKKRPKKPYKMNGELSATGLKWKKLCDENQIDFDSEEEYKVQIGTKPPNSGSTTQIKDWLYSLGWEPETYKVVKKKGSDEPPKKVPQIKNPDTGLICDSVAKVASKYPEVQYLNDLGVIRHRASVVAGFLRDVDDKGFIVAGVQGMTNTLRLKHRTAVNIPSTRAPYGEQIRSLLIARNPKTTLCGSDMSSLEDRTKLHYMWPHDPDYVKEQMSPGFDPHLAIAVQAGMMTEAEAESYKNGTAKDKERLTKIRSAAKATNYACTYGAGASTVARSAGVPEREGAILHKAYWAKNWSLKAIADNAEVKTSRGEKWIWNPVAKIWLNLRNDKDRFSTLNQSTGTYAFDRWVYHIRKLRPQLTAQFHDEIILELLKGKEEGVEELIRDSITAVNEELQLNRELDCDVQFADNYAGIH